MGMRDVDVLVAGAGISGCTVAILLARAGWRVLLVDAGQPVTETGESLAAVAGAHLRALGLWNGFARTAPLGATGIGGRWGQWTFDRSGVFSPYGEGWIVDKRAWLQVLRETAIDTGVEHALRTQVAEIAQVRSAIGHGPDASAGDGGFEVELRDDDGGPRIVFARRVVDATGQSARPGRRLGAIRHVFAPQAAALWRLGSDDVHETGRPACMRVGSHVQGWWYLAPLPSGGFALTAYYVPRPGLHRVAHPWRAIMNDAAQDLKLGGECPVRPVHLSASSAYLDNCAGPGWAAAGDAAASLDPLASTGMLHALRSGARVAEAMALDLSGDPRALQRYAEQVRAMVLEFRLKRAQVYGQAG